MATLKINICGIDFPNPIWTAAGPTAANAEMMKQAARGGAGGLVAKTLSIEQAKVPIPNIASPFPGTLLNAEKWSEIDYREMIETELPEASETGIPIIASIGYTPEDLKTLSRLLEKSSAVAAVEFSIHYVKKDPENLRQMARAIRDHTSLPVLAKLSPAVADLNEVINALDSVVDGYVAINSLGPALDFNIETLKPLLGSDDGRGWMSGRAILPIGLHFVESIYSQTKKPVLGVGGIRSVTDVIKYLMAGASAVQISSAAILRGANIYGKLAEGLVKWMEKHGYGTVSELTGAFCRRKRTGTYVLGENTQLYPDIVYENCRYCDACVKACMYDAIRFEEKEYIFKKEKCVSCGLCTTVCPHSALEMIEG